MGLMEALVSSVQLRTPRSVNIVGITPTNRDIDSSYRTWATKGQGMDRTEQARARFFLLGGSPGSLHSLLYFSGSQNSLATYHLPFLAALLWNIPYHLLKSRLSHSKSLSALLRDLSPKTKKPPLGCWGNLGKCELEPRPACGRKCPLYCSASAVPKLGYETGKKLWFWEDQH